VLRCAPTFSESKTNMLDSQMNPNASIKFVQAHGNALERARLGAVVWGQVPDEAVVKSLARHGELGEC